MKTGRNDPCPCNSGKKYKKCCLQKDLEAKRDSLKEKCDYCKQVLDPDGHHRELKINETIEGVHTEQVLRFCSDECDWASMLEAHILMGMGGYDAVNHISFNHDSPTEVLTVAIDTIMKKGNLDVKKTLSDEMEDIRHLL